MTDLLIVDNDLESAHAIREMAKRLGHKAVVAQSAQHALSFVEERRFTIVLIDRTLPDNGCHTLLTSLLNRAGDTRAIVMGSAISATDHKWALSLGAIDTLTKPLRPDELQAALRKAIDSGEGVPAQIHGLSLTDIIQAFGMAKRSVTVKAGASGLIYMRNGEIIHAVDGPRTGVDALKSVLFNKIPSLETGPLEPCEETIEQSLDSLLLDVMVEKDTSSRDLGLLEKEGESPAPMDNDEIGFDLVADDTDGAGPPGGADHAGESTSEDATFEDATCENADDTTPPRASGHVDNARDFAFAFDDATVPHTSTAELGSTEVSPAKRPAWVPIAVATAALAIAASLGLGFLLLRSSEPAHPTIEPSLATRPSPATPPRRATRAMPPEPTTPPTRPAPTTAAGETTPLGEATALGETTTGEASDPTTKTEDEPSALGNQEDERHAHANTQPSAQPNAQPSGPPNTPPNTQPNTQPNAQPSNGDAPRRRTKRRVGARTRPPAQPSTPSSVRSKLKSNPYD
ncbi:MAG: response regulator [Deltaproteobacteria bacterium]|nr:response regulator [Deltaproteobacteria bacterium]